MNAVLTKVRFRIEQPVDWVLEYAPRWMLGLLIWVLAVELFFTGLGVLFTLLASGLDQLAALIG